MHPSFNVKKIYKAELDHPLTKGDFQAISEGVRLEEGRAKRLLTRLERATEQAVEQIEEQYGLDDPVYVQYLKYLETVVIDRDLGTSVRSLRPVSDELKERFPATIELAFAAMVFSVLFGIPLGFVAAKRYGGPLDHASLVASLIGVSIPIFFLAILLKYVFAVKLGWLPLADMRGAYTPGVEIGFNLTFVMDALFHAALPIWCYILTSVGGWMLVAMSARVDPPTASRTVCLLIARLIACRTRTSSNGARWALKPT
jgi:ABC-type dipeptide/oligopeptide/nickel transport system permease component